MEYPFKDLMPLDEVLEREGYYKDWTHLDPEVFYSLTQISEYIKTKGYGVDVRLLIAQLAEHFGLKTTQVVDLANLLQQKFTKLEGVTQSFTNNINSLVAQMEADKNTIVANATVDSEVILARGGKATLGQRLDETAAHLAQTDEVTAERIGMIPNSEDSANQNYTYLCQALNDGYTVIINNTYFISGTTGNVSQLKLGGDGTLIIKDATTQIVSNGSVHIEDITIDLKESVLRDPNTPLITISGNADHIICDNVKNNRYIFLIRLNNTESTHKKVSRITLTNNKFEKPQLLFHLYKVDVGSISIYNNNFHNSETVPINFNTVNCPNVTINNNIMENDSDFWTGVVTTYFAMILLTGNGTCNYTNNIVKGLKTRHANMAVYDAYLSYTDVYWSNNTWVDNVNTSEVEGFNVLFYGKDDGGGLGGGTRTVLSNTYKITPSLLSRLTEQEKNNVQLTIYRFQFTVESFIFKNNVIDVGLIKLRGNLGDQFFNNFIFEGNNIKGHLNYDFFRIKANNLESYSSVSSNSIISTGDTLINLFYKTGAVSASDMVGKLLFNNNFLSFPYGTLVARLAVKEFQMNNNTIINTSSVSTLTSLVNDSIFEAINGVNNTVDSRSPFSDFGRYVTYTKMNMEITKNILSASDGTSLFKMPDNSSGFVRFDEVKNSGYEIYHTSYSLDGNQITYDKDNSSITEAFETNKVPISTKNHLTFNATTKTLNFIFSSNVIYSLKIKYMIN